MCNTCGCNVTDANRHLLDEHADHDHDHHHHHDHHHGEPPAAAAGTVAVLKRLLDANDHEAAHNREHFDEYGVLAINLMSSPGSGKTRLLEATIEALGGELRIGVIEGDLETENDAARIAMQLSNIFRAQGLGELSRLAYYDMKDKQFKWM